MGNAIDEELRRAAIDGNLSEVKELIRKGANVEATNEYGRTALHKASWNSYLEVVKYLVEQGNANVDVTNKDGRTALHNASANGHLEVVKYLVEQQNANVDTTDSDGRTALQLAKQFGHLKVVEYLEAARQRLKVEQDRRRLEIEQEKLQKEVAERQRIETTASQLRLAIDRTTTNPVNITASYLKMIRTDKILGKGFYGIVYRGFDPFLQQEFAVKVIDQQVIEGASIQRVEGIQKSFQNEMEVSIIFPCSVHRMRLLQLLGFSIID
jgi:hypothetical protein